MQNIINTDPLVAATGQKLQTMLGVITKEVVAMQYPLESTPADLPRLQSVLEDAANTVASLSLTLRVLQDAHGAAKAFINLVTPKDAA